MNNKRELLEAIAGAMIAAIVLYYTYVWLQELVLEMGR